MRLDPDACYQLLLARDARYDGRFFTGVVTTGIYCRPICPAPPPKRANVRFFPSAAAAGEAGFRPCLRCRPEASPDSSGWLGTEALVKRALRRIGEGQLDDRDLERFATGLGVGSRHLRRLFRRHVGASPAAVARTRRLLLAKKLIDETALPMTEVAAAAGFASLRRFNAALRASYDRTPTELRRLARGRGSTAGRGLSLTLAVRPPFDWDALLRFLGPRAIPGVERVDGESYRRTFRIRGVTGTVHVTPLADEAGVRLELLAEDARVLPDVVDRIRRLFDLDADPETIHEQLGRDPTLEPLIGRAPGLRLPGAWDAFELALRAVLGQQITVRGATTISGRLARSCGSPLGFDAGDGLDVVFPEPAQLVDADLGSLGLPAARQATLRAVARACLEERQVEDWTAIRGVGDWTAQYIAMRAYREPDAFPTGDLGLRKAVTDNGRPASAAELGRMAEAWRPWRAYAAMHLWNGLSG